MIATPYSRIVDEALDFQDLIKLYRDGLDYSSIYVWRRRVVEAVSSYLAEHGQTVRLPNRVLLDDDEYFATGVFLDTKKDVLVMTEESVSLALFTLSNSDIYNILFQLIQLNKL